MPGTQRSRRPDRGSPRTECQFGTPAGAWWSVVDEWFEALACALASHTELGADHAQDSPARCAARTAASIRPSASRPADAAARSQKGDMAISIQPELISSKIFPHPVFADVPSQSKSQPTAKRLRASSQRSCRHPARRLPGRRLRRLREQHDDHVAVIERMRTHSCGESIGAMSVERVTAGVVRLPDL